MPSISTSRALLLTLALTACHGSSAPAPQASAMTQVAPTDLLRQVVERYWDENAALNPWYAWYGTGVYFAAVPAGAIDPQVLADSLALERRALADLSAIPVAALDPEAALTYEMFQRQRRAAIEGLTFPFELLPVNPYEGIPWQFASAAGAAERLALTNPKNFAEWRTRVRNFSSWSAEAIAGMRDGLRRGYTLPRPLVEELLPQLAALGRDGDANAFFQPLRSDPAAEPLKSLIREQVLPAYRALHDFLQNEYLARARSTVALSALPLGDAWYAYLVRRSTGGTRTAAELHAAGLEEVDRLQRRLQALVTESGFADSVGFLEHLRHDERYAYSVAEALTGATEDLKLRVANTAPSVFAVLPTADFAIRPADAYLEPGARSVFYRASGPNGAIGPVLYVDTAGLQFRPIVDLQSQYLFAAVPGHHLQMQLQRERADLPTFRRFGVEPSFNDGWALYALTLGEELGLYTSAESKYDELRTELACAAGLVVDTGLQADGWTRQRAIDYLQKLLADDGPVAAARVDRMIALPGEALACTVGALRLQALRSLAQQSMGSHFDLREFNSELVRGGAMPLDLLATHMQSWMKQSVADAIAAEAAARAASTADVAPASKVD